MPTQSTFFGLTIGDSGLSTYQAAINTTANNIANVNTKGYSRQQTVIEAAQAMRTYTDYGTMGTGVKATAIEQLRDLYYDAKYYKANSKLNNYETKAYYLNQIQTYFQDDETVDGFATIFSKMYNSLESLNTDAAEYSKRQNYVSNAQSLMTYFNNMSTQLSELQEEINSVIETDVEDINSIAKKIAELNSKINLVELTGENANELRDQRALLLDELSQFVSVETDEQVAPDVTGVTRFTVKINGAVLVETERYNQLECVERENRINQSDADGLVDIYWKDSTGATTSIKFDPTIGSAEGALKSLFLVRDGNNENNFTGTISGFGSSTYVDKAGISHSATAVTITNPSQTTLDDISVPSSGLITLNGTQYSYQGFELETGSSGNFIYTFHLTEELDSATQTGLSGMNAQIGKAEDYMGIPYYQQQMNAFLREFATKYNRIQQSGQDLYGNTGKAFYQAENKYSSGSTLYDFSGVNTWETGNGNTLINTYDITAQTKSNYYYYYYMTGSTAKVNEDLVVDANKVVTANYKSLKKTTDTTVDASKKYYIYDADEDKYELVKQPLSSALSSYYERTGTISVDPDTGFVANKDESNLVEDFYDLCTKERIFRSTSADQFLQCIISDVSIDTNEAETFQTNYENVVDSITSQRTSVSGVDEDEEALDLVKFQNAYNLSSKLIQVLSEMYDKLIQETGV